MRFIKYQLFIAMTGILVAAQPAEAAEHADIIHFQQLDASVVEAGAIEVAYSITASDWERLADDGGRMRLDLFVATDARGGDFEFAQSQEIDAPEGRVRFEAQPFGRAVQLGAGAVDVALGERLGRRLRLPMQEATAPKQADDTYDPARHRRWRAGVERACRRVTKFQREREECVGLVNGLRHRASAVNTIRSCDAATGHTGELFGCLRDASQLEEDPAPVVDACRRSVSSPRLGICLREASEVDEDADDAVRTCSEQGDDQAVISCLRRTSRQLGANSLTGADEARRRAASLARN